MVPKLTVSKEHLISYSPRGGVLISEYDSRFKGTLNRVPVVGGVVLIG